MRTHVKVLGVLYIVLGILGLMFAGFMTLIFVTATGVVGVNAEPRDAAIAIPFIGIAGTMAVVFLLALSIPGIIVGIGLLRFRPWARIVGIVLSFLYVLHFPFGTVVAIYGLWVLFTRETESLFEASPGVAH